MLDAVANEVNGTILKDSENRPNYGLMCSEDDHNKCMDQCAAEEWDKLEKNTPMYSISGGSDCQTVENKVYQTCFAKCKK